MNIDYTYVRAQKAKKLKEWHNKELKEKETLSYEVFSNAWLLPAKKSDQILFGLGGVVTENKVYVANSGIDERFGGNYEFHSDYYRDEKVVYCGYLINHWGHFLIESVARMWYFLKNDTSIDKYVFVSDLDGNAYVGGNYYEFFELLGVGDKLEIITRPARFREVIVPELGYKRSEYYSREYRDIFRIVKERALLKCASTSADMPNKVFLSRRFFAEKTEVGVEMLDNFFLRNNWHVLYPERVSLSEMICLLNNAEICATESGTLPHNFLFAGNGKKVVIVERQDTINEVQVDVDKIKKLDATYVDGYFTIYPVGAGYGPYYLAYNTYLRNFAHQYNMIAPSTQYFSEKYKKKCVAKYMKIYRNNYGYKWALEKWQLPYVPLYYEAYIDTCRELDEYLSGKRCFKIAQCFHFTYFKMQVKQFLLNKKVV